MPVQSTMSLGLSTVAVWGYSTAVLANLAFAGYLTRRGFLGEHRDSATRAFFAAIVATIVWAGAALAEQAWDVASEITLLSDQLRYAAWFVFVLLSIRPAPAVVDRGTFRMLVGVAMALVAWGTAAWVQSVGSSGGHAGGLIANSLALAVFGVVLLEQLFRNQSETSRWNAKPVCIALGFVFVFDLYVFTESVLFGSFDDDALAVRGAVHALATPLLLLATRRDSEWVAKIQVSRTVAFYSAALLLVGAYLLFISGVGYYVRYFGGSWGRALQMALLFAALLMMVVVLVSGTLRSRLRVFLGKNFFSYRYDYRQEWLRFTGMLSTNNSPQEVGTLVVRGLADMVECPAGSLWSRQLGDEAFVQTARWNMPALAEREPVDSAFCQSLMASEWIIDIEEFRSHPRRYDHLVVPLWLATSPVAWLVVPLIVGEGLIGFVVLARPRTAVSLNWEVRDLLKTAARQAASFLAQMHATEALLEARKFDAFNRMSAFVVHDLKNIITQLSLMLKNAQRHHDNPEFQQDMLLTVESSLEKMRQMMTQLREGDKPVVGATSGVDLPAVLARLEAMARARGRKLDVEIVDRVATRGHTQRLERVLGHVVQNALEATPVSGRVWVSLRQSVGRASVTIGDTGSGMSPEFIQSQLFRPFSSTKQSGMGIGTYESYQYIKELGGSISVDSELGRGTVVSILLPLFDMQIRSDLQMSAAP